MDERTVLDMHDSIASIVFQTDPAGWFRSRLIVSSRVEALPAVAQLAHVAVEHVHRAVAISAAMLLLSSAGCLTLKPMFAIAYPVEQGKSA